MFRDLPGPQELGQVIVPGATVKQGQGSHCDQELDWPPGTRPIEERFSFKRTGIDDDRDQCENRNDIEEQAVVSVAVPEAVFQVNHHSLGDEEAVEGAPGGPANC